jgi:hypothetical protein
MRSLGVLLESIHPIGQGALLSGSSRNVSDVTTQAAAVKQHMAEQLGEQVGLLLRIDLEERGHEKSGNR